MRRLDPEAYAFMSCMGCILVSKNPDVWMCVSSIAYSMGTPDESWEFLDVRETPATELRLTNEICIAPAAAAAANSAQNAKTNELQGTLSSSYQQNGYHGYHSKGLASTGGPCVVTAVSHTNVGTVLAVHAHVASSCCHASD